MIHLKQTEFYQDWVERSSQLIRVLSHKTICHCVASSPVFFRNYKALGQAVCEICCVYCVYTRNFNNAQLSWACMGENSMWQSNSKRNSLCTNLYTVWKFQRSRTNSFWDTVCLFGSIGQYSINLLITQ